MDNLADGPLPRPEPWPDPYDAAVDDELCRAKDPEENKNACD